MLRFCYGLFLEKEKFLKNKISKDFVHPTIDILGSEDIVDHHPFLDATDFAECALIPKILPISLSWESYTVLEFLKDSFLHPEWKSVSDTAEWYNIPIDNSVFWCLWQENKFVIQRLGFQPRPNRDEYCQDEESDWIVFFNPLIYLDVLEDTPEIGRRLDIGLEMQLKHDPISDIIIREIVFTISKLL